MILRMGKKYRGPGLILAGFIIFLGAFLLLTQNSHLFQASADTTVPVTSQAAANPCATNTSPTNNDGFGTQNLFNSLSNLSQDQANCDATGNIYARVASVINLLLAVASVAMVFGIVWSGLLMISSMGNEEQAKKAKSNITMLLIGLAVLLASFTIVTVIQNILKGTGISG